MYKELKEYIKEKAALYCSVQKTSIDSLASPVSNVVNDYESCYTTKAVLKKLVSLPL